MRIRPARPDDHDQWLPLWRGYQSFYKVDLPPEQSALNWQRFLDPAEPVFCAVAEDDSAQGGGRLVGMVHYLYHRSCWTAGDYCYLQDLFAAPDCRGRGVGRALIEHVYAAAEAGGASRVWWLTHETNSDAMLLYDRISARSGFLQYRKLLG